MAPGRSRRWQDPGNMGLVSLFDGQPVPFPPKATWVIAKLTRRGQGKRIGKETRLVILIKSTAIPQCTHNEGFLFSLLWYGLLGGKDVNQLRPQQHQPMQSPAVLSEMTKQKECSLSPKDRKGYSNSNQDDTVQMERRISHSKNEYKVTKFL